jgi:cystathionine beta-lyase
MIYEFDHMPDRRPTDSVKWNLYDSDVLPMWVADMDFTVAEPIRQSLRERIEHGIFGYPSVHPKPEEVTGFKQVLIERMHMLYNWNVAAEEIILLPGVITGLNLTCQAVAAADGNVVVQTPVYPPFLSVASHANMHRVDVPLHRLADGRYEIDWDVFDAGLTDKTRLFILCNPHNPVGRVFRKEELERMAEICLHKGVSICSDEIHCDLIFNGHKHIPIASLGKEISRNTVTLMSPTKTFNIAGLQCSFAIVQNEELRKKLNGSMKGLVMWVNMFGTNAAEVAYRDGQEWLSQVMNYLEGNRDYLYKTIKTELPELDMVKPEGTYLAWLDCRHSGIQGNPYEFFLREARVAFNDGVTFGEGGEGFVRLNFACTRQTLTQVLERMKAALSRIR